MAAVAAVAAWQRESEVHQIGISVAKWAALFSRESVGKERRGVWGHLGHVACKVNVASRRKKEMHNAAAVAAERSNLAKMANKKSKTKQRKM